MSKFNTSEFKSGLKVMLDGSPCNIVENEFVKPGKGQAFNRVKLRNLLTGRMLEKTFKSSESIEGADVLEAEAQYLYCDGEAWHFMINDTFEQYTADANAMADAKPWIKEQDECTLTLWNNKPISVVPPTTVTLTITETDPGLKGDTSGGGSKPATLETGTVIRVPLFIQEGELIKVNTKTGEYLARAKE